MSTATANANSTTTNSTPTIDVQAKVRETVCYPHNREDRVKRQAVVLTVIAEGFDRSTAEELVPNDRVWFEVKEPDPDPEPEESEDTDGDFINTEPLDNAPDHYGFRSPIATDRRLIVDDDYVNPDGSVQTLETAIRTYVGSMRGERTSAETNGFYKTSHSRALSRYWCLLEGDRLLIQEYEQPVIGFLSLRLSPSDNWHRADLLESLTTAWNDGYGVLDKLRYQLRDSANGPSLPSDAYETAYVIAGTDNGRGTPHLHIAVYCDGAKAACQIDSAIFEPVIDKWVSENPYAAESGHESTSNTIRVEGTKQPDSAEETSIPMATDKSPENSQVALYIGKQLPHIFKVPRENDPEPWPEQSELIHSAVCHATQTAGFGTSQSWPAQVTKQPDSAEETPFDIELDLS